MPDKRLIFGIFFLFAINLVQAYFTPISEDEAYYWLWSQNLDWGYFDHPPMVAWWISIGYKIFQNELGVRLATVFLNSSCFFFLWKILNPKTTKQIRLFFLVLGSILVIQIFGFLTTPDAPLLFFLVLYLFSLEKLIEGNSRTTVLLLAISFAGLMYSKYHGILVLVFTLLPIWKIWWKNSKFYLAVLGSLVLYSPHILWLIQHDFLPLRYHFLERSADEHFELRKLANYLLIYFLGAAPLLSYFIIVAIGKFKAENSFQKSIWWLAILPGIFFLISIFKDNVQPQWLLISFVAMGILTYYYYKNSDRLNILFLCSFIGISVVFIFRIVLLIPSISPLEKNIIFAQNIGRFQPENPVFEKYQEASVYKFYHPKNGVAVHRTLGNRRSQFSLWKSEENYFGKTVTYISPWVKAENSFIGYKNRNYYLKEIKNYQTFDFVEIETIKKLVGSSNERIELELTITNHHSHPITIGGDSEFQLNANYYRDLQYEIDYKIVIPVREFTLQTNESKSLKVRFKNIDQKGFYKLCFGLNYSPIGTSYLSAPIEVKSL